MEQLPWPDLYRVRFHDVRKRSYEYTTLTWLDERKALVLATMRHQVIHPDSDREIYSVEIERLGRADANEDGTVSLEGVDAADRREF